VEPPKGRRGRVVLVASESLAVRAEPVALVVLESQAVRAGLVALVVLESQAVRAGLVALAVPESLAVRAEPVVQVGPESEQKLAVAEQGNVPAAGPARSRAEAAVALTVSEVINPRKVAAVAPSAEEVGQVPKRPAVAVAPAWAGAAAKVEAEAKAEAAAVKAVVAGADR